MEHVVFFTGADGAAQYRRTPSLEEAVRVVEHLRNVEGVEDSRVFSMSEVPLSYKAVYRVEIPGHVAETAPPLPPMPPMPEMDLGVGQPAAEAPAPPAPVDEPVLAAVPSEPFAAEPAPEPVSNGRRGSGFFAR